MEVIAWKPPFFLRFEFIHHFRRVRTLRYLYVMDFKFVSQSLFIRVLNKSGLFGSSIQLLKYSKCLLKIPFIGPGYWCVCVCVCVSQLSIIT